jgi:hypothetical protein
VIPLALWVPASLPSEAGGAGCRPSFARQLQYCCDKAFCLLNITAGLVTAAHLIQISFQGLHSFPAGCSQRHNCGVIWVPPPGQTSTISKPLPLQELAAFTKNVLLYLSRSLRALHRNVQQYRFAHYNHVWVVSWHA